MPPGRPTLLTQVVRVREDGTSVTAAEQIVERVRLGLDLATAAASAGVARSTLQKWRLHGARARAHLAQGRGPLTPKDTELAAFADMLEVAEADFETSNLAVIRQAAAGGATTVKVTEKHDANGVLVETTTVTSTLRKEWTASAWLLERRRPAKYARRYELTGAEGAPLVPPAEAARAIADSLTDFQAGVAAAEELAKQAKD